MTGEVTRCESNETLIAMNSKLGWIFQGNTNCMTPDIAASRITVCVLNTSVQESDKVLRSFWELDSAEISDAVDNDSRLSPVLMKFEEIITLRDGTYEVMLPWKEEVELSDKKQVVITKLICRLSSKQGLLETYDKTIGAYLRAGHAEIVERPPLDPTKVYYVLRREVIREHPLTTKVRIVFDASSDAKGCFSLNECLKKDDETLQICCEAKEIIQEAGMTLRKWTTNSDSLINALEYEEQSAGKELVVLNETSVKVLGITCNPPTETFTFSVRGLLEFMKEKDGTKRFVLQAASRIFDQMGFVALFTVAIKIFQKFWIRGRDEQLPQDLQDEWHEWVRQLPVLQNIPYNVILAAEPSGPECYRLTYFATRALRHTAQRATSYRAAQRGPSC
ncbi:hypothetical protein HPB50_010846 [Hyalomma asiaticum]|uniref:Uncharacterized protein n=1 Tax=Hyalomma asiaticum TaxID=266040 RepID=A0ACB7RNK4_HYAAI|nr:hypothetical protein HPB50_010846 [Hyalomma asiaticum]